MQNDEFLRQRAVAKRWNLSERTIERWRWLGTGPIYYKIGGRVVYRLEDIIAFENSRAFTCTAQQGM